MKRIEICERPNWKATAENMGFKFHTIDGERYWDESAYYEFSLKQIENDLEDPTQELHGMCMDLAEKIVHSEKLMSQLAIPAEYHDLILTSWKEGHPHLYGRMDFSYDGTGPAKLLELNYDTPTSIYEASCFQWIWLEEQIHRGNLPSTSDQFNSIEDKLFEAFRHFKQNLGFDAPFYFAATKHSDEDISTVNYLKDLASQAGHQTNFVAIEDIGQNEHRLFIDPDDRHIHYLFKLHAWEHIFQEGFGPWIESAQTLFIEPAWKSILSNKGILPMLWAEHEGHPNLLPSYFDPNPQSSIRNGWVRKPFFSREGANIELVTPTGEPLKVDGPYTDAPYILQEFKALPKYGDSFTLIGSWVVGDKACGIGIREDDSLITKDSSRFLPHLIKD